MSRKRISVKEFREEGYLQEANRLFFHPLGLALEVLVNPETGDMEFSGVWDSRNDLEGILFDSWDEGKMAKVKEELETRKKSRVKLSECDENGIQVKPYHI